MELKKIYFKAFKSLIEQELNIENNCIGIVGTNESGKSNILSAINTLGGNRPLSIKDFPKISKEPAELDFVLIPNDQETELLNSSIKKWSVTNTLLKESLKFDKFEIVYNTKYDKQSNKIITSFILKNISINKDCLVLKNEFLNDNYKIKTKNDFIPLNKSIILTKEDIEYSDKFYLNIYKDIEKIDIEISKIKEVIKTKPTNNGSIKRIPTPIDKDSITLADLIKQKEKLESKLEYNSNIIEKKLKSTIDKLKKDIEIIEKKITDTTLSVKQFEGKNRNSPNLKRAYTTSKNNLTKLKNELIERKKNLEDTEIKLSHLYTPLVEKYTDNLHELNKYFEFLLNDIKLILPKVVFWEHSNEFIIKSETLFDELLNKTDLNDISRPLVNIFRIGLKIKDINDLKNWLKEIRVDSNERSKKERKLNNEVNKYIKSVWVDYDQEIKITLEKDQIRIEIYDPNYEDRSYFNMEDRSQGAQTFLSFLLTIGAEAKQGVIKDTILLLDEPETHLHPSGVRFMLKELLKIAKNSNTVIYATHSIFMIDRNNLDRHIILDKKKEKTSIKPARIDRIGFFMQEEVLYKTLDIDLSSDFTFSKKYNFVFEGYGDSLLFEHFYSKILSQKPFNIKNISFYQGGKCSDIQKYFTNNPIQLGSKWIFIIDKDKPANKLKLFLEGKYKDYLNKDIFVFQFEKGEEKENFDIELEDLLPNNIIHESYSKTIDFFDLSFDKKELKKIIKENTYYSEYNEIVLSIVDTDIDKEDFKGKFKELLNQEIKINISECNNEDTFKSKFSEFYNWSMNVIKELK